jgi:hypothetical protein
MGGDLKKGLVAALEESGEQTEGIQKLMKDLSTEGAEIDLGSLDAKELKTVQSAVG